MFKTTSSNSLPSFFGVSFARSVQLVVVLFAFSLLGAGCVQEVDPSLTVRDFDPNDIRMTVDALGRLDDAEVKTRREKGDIDGVARLKKGACKGSCSYALVSVYVDNKGDHRFAPPVLRMEVPKKRPARLAVSFRGHEISPHRTGRIRWLVELWPEEKVLNAHLSSSVFLDVGAAPKPPSPLSLDENVKPDKLPMR